MFIQHLNIVQQAALYHFSKKLISVDGHVDERETVLLETIALQCQKDLDKNVSFDISQLPDLFAEHPQKMAFLIELVGVGYADQTLEESEANFIAHIAETLNVDALRLVEIQSWVQRQIILVSEAQKFLE